MEILNPRSLREDAARALARGRDPKKLVRTYVGITLALMALMTLADQWLNTQISGTSGLSNLGNRAIFSTAQAILPYAVIPVILCLDLGYLGGMMRIARGQYADHTDLKIGFRKFWPLMRLTLLQGLISLAVGFLAMQAGSVIFALTPWGEASVEAMMTLLTMDLEATTEEAVLAQLIRMMPMYAFCGIVYLVALIPVAHRMRFARACLLDDPNSRARAAIAVSNNLMRRRFGAMLKIDLSLWLYYVAMAVVNLVMLGDVFLAAFGMILPMDATVSSLLFYAAGLVLQFVIQTQLRNRVEATYLLAYDRLREPQKEGGPVVLGNIFDM